MNNSILDKELQIGGYALQQGERGKGQYGGVLCYIRNDIKYQRQLDLEFPGLEKFSLKLL